MSDLAVVHLVRRQNGLPPFERFLSSYREHPAGASHDLVIVFKGFSAEDRTRDYDRLLDEVPHRRLFVSDRGFDLTAYFKSVEELDHERFCFLNSYSRILDDGWLAKLSRWLGKKALGWWGPPARGKASGAGIRRTKRGCAPCRARLECARISAQSSPARAHAASRARGAPARGDLATFGATSRLFPTVTCAPTRS